MAKIQNAYYDKETNTFYRDTAHTKPITPKRDVRYRNVADSKIYVWNGNEYIDGAFYTDYSYSEYDNITYIEPNKIYLALPGHRVLAAIQGINESSCNLTQHLNNTDELSFTVDREVDGKIQQFYGQIARHNELYIPGHGWFKITEEPEITNDGTHETKSVVAESGEIELQQFDLVTF